MRKEGRGNDLLRDLKEKVTFGVGIKKTEMCIFQCCLSEGFTSFSDHLSQVGILLNSLHPFPGIEKAMSVKNIPKIVNT